MPPRRKKAASKPLEPSVLEDQPVEDAPKPVRKVGRPKKDPEVTIKCLSTRTRSLSLNDGKNILLSLGQSYTGPESIVVSERLRELVRKGIFAFA